MTFVPAAAPSPLLESLGDGEFVEFIADENRAVMACRVTAADGEVLATATSTVKLVPVDRTQ
jgi:hypothetical protein